MAISAANLKLSVVLAEFGAPPSTPLADMLRGGAYVPENTINGESIPEALPISLSDFVGTARPPSLAYHSKSASEGSLTVTPYDTLNIRADYSHSPGSGVSFASFAGVATFNFQVQAATTPRLRLALQAGHFSPGPGIFLPFSDTDSPTPLPSGTDEFGAHSAQVLFRSQVPADGAIAEVISTIVGAPANVVDRVAQAVVLTDGAVVGTIVSVQIFYQHNLSEVSFSAYSHNAASKVTFALSFMFVDGGGALVAEQEFMIDFYPAGLLETAP